jgi:hypothetical protein
MNTIKDLVHNFLFASDNIKMPTGTFYDNDFDVDDLKPDFVTPEGINTILKGASTMLDMKNYLSGGDNDVNKTYRSSIPTFSG